MSSSNNLNQDKGPTVRIDDSHFSKHGIKGKKDTHIISQDIDVGGKQAKIWTNVDKQGSVGKSGIDLPKK